MSGLRRRRTRLPLFLLTAAAVCLCLRLFVFHTLRIEGSSMENTLTGGNIVLVSSLAYSLGRTPERGDIVECGFPNRSGTYVKRVIGLPGETVEIRDGQTFINGLPLSESYVSSKAEDYTVTLGEDAYLMLGDNRAESYDSRAEDMGSISSDYFYGRVVSVLYPFRILN